MGQCVFKLLATATIILWPVTLIYIESNSPLLTKAEVAIGEALSIAAILCTVACAIMAVWAFLP
jgi:hypothetical protein